MKCETRVFAAEVENLPAVTSFVEACAERRGLRSQAKFGLLLALEEAFVNICHYAYPEHSGTADITCETDGDLFVLEIADHGHPFDVLSLPEPDITADLMHRKVGGLGVHFIRTVSNSVSYRREDDRNVLRMAFRP
jgi:anti-sigma regulatory factor (Ser/Thr protein kinase)